MSKEEFAPTGKPTLSIHGDVYRLTWPCQIEIEVERISEHRDELSGEITVRSSRPPSPGLLVSARVNLMSTQTRKGLANACAEREPDLDWFAIVEATCYLVRERYREGEPSVDMRTFAPSGRARAHVEPFTEHGGATALFGDGDSGKTTLSIAVAITAATGCPVIGQLQGEPRPVEFYDYEGDDETFHERMRATCVGANISAAPAIYYRRMTSSLHEAAPTLRREIADHGSGLAIVDSAGLACGGDPQAADVVLRLFAAVRSLAVPVLLIDHVAKNAVDQGKAYGSVYKHNAPRITWRVDRAKDEDADALTVALIPMKRNNGRPSTRRGYKIVFENDGGDRLRSVRFQPADLARDYPEKATLRQRILAELQAGGVPPDAIAESLQADAKQVRSRLGELEKRGVVRRMPDGTVWLAAERAAS